jgi:hypothetical protein
MNNPMTELEIEQRKALLALQARVVDLERRMEDTEKIIKAFLTEPVS